MMSVKNFALGVAMAAASIPGCSEEPKELSRVPYSNGHCILREDGMVIIECSGGRDMLPVTLVSQELVDAFMKDLESKSK